MLLRGDAYIFKYKNSRGSSLLEMWLTTTVKFKILLIFLDILGYYRNKLEYYCIFGYFSIIVSLKFTFEIY